MNTLYGRGADREYSVHTAPAAREAATPHPSPDVRVSSIARPDFRSGRDGIDSIMMEMSDKKLFVFYLGGAAPGANIEVHDVQFAVAERPEEAHAGLVARWFGTRGSLHIDAYGIVSWADGYSISLRPEPQARAPRLYFINMGGYEPGALREEHEFTFLVAHSPDEAKSKARHMLLPGRTHRHRDNFMEVDDCVPLDQIDGLHIHLTPCEEGSPVTAAWQGYERI
jgi:hypothetical protein